MKQITRRKFIKVSGTVAGLIPLAKLEALAATGLKNLQDAYAIDDNQQVFLPPENQAEWSAYREALHRWRNTAKTRLRYSDVLYGRQDFAWVSSSFCCCFVMMNDETFYDAAKGEYTVDTFLETGKKEFGGYDSIVLWHAYPRIGIDERNQFDIYRQMPGGLSGLKQLSGRLHQKGVKVFIDYNPWDKGTRREDEDDMSLIAGIVKAIDADGIFLDTMSKGSEALREKVDTARPGVVFEGEGALPLENIHDHHMSWAQYFPTGTSAPGVLRDKWLERRHMQHQIRRWEHDHTAELHTAWMNGSGMMVWENVFGSWVGWNQRDKSILRSMLPIQRRFSSLFSGEGWTPFIPAAVPGIYASCWEEKGIQLYTLVNRLEEVKAGTLLKIAPVKDALYFDLITGLELKPEQDGNEILLNGHIAPRGIGAYLVATKDNLGKDLSSFLADQSRLFKQADFDTTFPEIRAALTPVHPSKRYTREQLPAGMIPVPGITAQLNSSFLIRECGLYDAASDISMLDSHYKTISIAREVRLRSFAMDETPVTNAQYAAFLKASGYTPKVTMNFLKHWIKGMPPAGKEDHPVVYVDLNDARAYARWAGKRLPTEDEWQYAAQGPELRPFGAERIYPWGNELKETYCNSGQTGGTTPVKAFPDGRSALGIYDLCGNTWELTESERSDGRTRFIIVKGGSYYHPDKKGYNIGYVWYVEHGPQPCDHAVKLLTVWPGLDRCSTIGFRCVADMDA